MISKPYIEKRNIDVLLMDDFQFIIGNIEKMIPESFSGTGELEICFEKSFYILTSNRISNIRRFSPFRTVRQFEWRSNT